LVHEVHRQCPSAVRHLCGEGYATIQKGYERAVTRPAQSTRSRFSTVIFLTGREIARRPVKSHFRWQPRLRDAGDEIVLETLLRGNSPSEQCARAVRLGLDPFECCSIHPTNRRLREVPRANSLGSNFYEYPPHVVLHDLAVTRFGRGDHLAEALARCSDGAVARLQ